jgi:hypothetical protein
MRNNTLFWIFGTLQSLSLAALIYVGFRCMNILHGSRLVGGDTQVVLSVSFPLFLLLVEYLVHSRCRGRSDTP